MADSYRDTFRGTAPYYARFRPGYPDGFFACLVEAFRLDGTGRVLDLGCGTGQIALPIARHCAQVVAMDPEAEMLGEARRAADEAGVGNISFVAGGSADLGRLREQLGMFRLVTMGSSFHWMDREATLATLAQMVVPGGGLVVAGAGSFWTNPAPWCQAVKSAIQRWLGEERRAGSATFAGLAERHEAVIDRSAFGPCKARVWHYRRTWAIDGIIGNLYSTSFCSPALLGDKRAGFENDLRNSLLSLSPDGQFVEDVELTALLGTLKRDTITAR